MTDRVPLRGRESRKSPLARNNALTLPYLPYSPPNSLVYLKDDRLKCVVRNLNQDAPTQLLIHFRTNQGNGRSSSPWRNGESSVQRGVIPLQPPARRPAPGSLDPVVAVWCKGRNVVVGCRRDSPWNPGEPSGSFAGAPRRAPTRTRGEEAAPHPLPSPRGSRGSAGCGGPRRGDDHGPPAASQWSLAP